MKLEEFENLSSDAKKAILLKWWGKNLKGKYNLDELVAYSILLDYYLEEILKVAIMYSLEGVGPEIILDAIRSQELTFLFATVANVDNTPVYDVLKRLFLEDITNELNYPGKSR